MHLIWQICGSIELSIASIESRWHIDCKAQHGAELIYSLEHAVDQAQSLCVIRKVCIAWVQDFNIDTDRMPLGQLSKEQVQRGYAVLERIRKAISTRSGSSSLQDLSSEFYQASHL